MTEGMTISATAADATLAGHAAATAARAASPAGSHVPDDDLPRPMTERSFLLIVGGVALAELTLLGWVAVRLLSGGP